MKVVARVEVRRVKAVEFAHAEPLRRADEERDVLRAAASEEETHI